MTKRKPRTRAAKLAVTGLNAVANGLNPERLAADVLSKRPPDSRLLECVQERLSFAAEPGTKYDLYFWMAPVGPWRRYAYGSSEEFTYVTTRAAGWWRNPAAAVPVSAKPRKRWVTVPDKSVRHVFDRAPGCRDCDTPKHAYWDGPAMINGTPVCCDCGEDYEYVRTEVRR